MLDTLHIYVQRSLAAGATALRSFMSGNTLSMLFH